MQHKTCYAIQGFTLLEIVITTAIVGLFALLTLPTYQDSVRTGRRGEAKAELLHLAQNQAKWRLTHTTYATLEQLGSTQTENYTFTVPLQTSTTFIISATPTSTRGQNKDICGVIQINQETVLTSNQSACPKP